jgi:hypothetical protein
MNGIDQCDCCGRTLNPGRIVFLELDQRIGCYHDFDRGVPDADSQGWFLFGPACAAKKRGEAKAAAKAAGIFLGRKTIGRVQQASMLIAHRKLNAN